MTLSGRQRDLLRLAMPWLAMALFLVLWELACIVFDLPEIILPRPTRVFVVFWQRLDILLMFCWETLWTTVIGFLIAIAGGMLLFFRRRGWLGAQANFDRWRKDESNES